MGHFVCVFHPQTIGIFYYILFCEHSKKYFVFSAVTMKKWPVFVCLISLVCPAPQLNIPANVFTSSSNGDIEAELTSVSVEDEDQVFSGRDLVSVLNTRARPGVSRVTSVNNGVIRTARPVTTTNRVFSSSFSSANAAANAANNNINDDGSNGQPMPYSFNYNVAGDDTQTYISREEESDGTTVTGSYRYVDPTGALIIVRYTAGVMGCTETRGRQEGYLEIRDQGSSSKRVTSSSVTSSSSSSGSGSNRFATSSTGQQQLTTTTLEKKVDQNALIAKII